MTTRQYWKHHTTEYLSRGLNTIHDVVYELLFKKEICFLQLIFYGRGSQRPHSTTTVAVAWHYQEILLENTLIYFSHINVYTFKSSNPLCTKNLYSSQCLFYSYQPKNFEEKGKIVLFSSTWLPVPFSITFCFQIL